jgi:hypothetical protein
VRTKHAHCERLYSSPQHLGRELGERLHCKNTMSLPKVVRWEATVLVFESDGEALGQPRKPENTTERAGFWRMRMLSKG